MTKLVRRTSMVGRQEMRKGNKTTTTGEKTKSIPYMIMKKMSEQIMKIEMPDMKIKMPDMNMKTNKMPDMRIQAGCGTLMFKHCLARRRVTPEVPLERKPGWRNSRKTRLWRCMMDATTGIPA